MIITLTFNPSLDLTYTLEESGMGEVDVHRARRTTIEASGKGVNVSRTLARAKVATHAVLPIAGRSGAHLAELLADEGVPTSTLEVPGETRINTSLLLHGGETVKVNGPGPSVSGQAARELLELTRQVLTAVPDAAEAPWIAVCGSLPPGLDPGILTEVVTLAHHHGARVAVDSSGAALRAAFTAGADLLAPNSLELGELTGEELGGAPVPAVAAAAAALAEEAGTELLVSMGSRGAVHAGPGQVIAGAGPVLTPVNTAGAGDAFLSGWLAGPGAPVERMARALAFGRSACLSPGTVDTDPGSRGGEGIEVHVLAAPEAPRP